VQIVEFYQVSSEPILENQMWVTFQTADTYCVSSNSKSLCQLTTITVAIMQKRLKKINIFY